MNAFELAQARTVAEAVQALGEANGSVGSPPGPAVQILAGGQDLLALMKDYVLQPERLVNLKGVAELRAIRREGQTLVIGALATLAEVAASDLVRSHAAALAEAAAEAATPQIRHHGTVGGNLCQKTRCWYYRAEAMHCLRKGGDVCLAAVGDHRYHSIFGESACMSPQMSALGIPATCYGATVRAAGPRGERTLTLPELYDSINHDPTQDTALAPNEVLTHLVVPTLPGWSVAHEEVRAKQAYDWPLAMATAALRLEGGVVREVRLILGAVAPTPHVDAEAAKVMIGQRPSQDLMARAAAAVLAPAHPTDQLTYKIPLTRHLVRRVLLKAAGLGDQDA